MTHRIKRENHLIFCVGIAHCLLVLAYKQAISHVVLEQDDTGSLQSAACAITSAMSSSSSCLQPLLADEILQASSLIRSHAMGKSKGEGEEQVRFVAVSLKTFQNGCSQVSIITINTGATTEMTSQSHHSQLSINGLGE
jgi:hypothetical protein